MKRSAAGGSWVSWKFNYQISKLLNYQIPSLQCLIQPRNELFARPCIDLRWFASFI